MIFTYTDYKEWVNETISAMPKKGRGQYMRIVEHLGTSSAIVTQIFKGDRELTPEQALLLSDYFGLNKPEQQYLLLLVSYSRAGSYRYKKILEEEIKEFQERAKEIKNRVPQNKELSEEAKAVLYSNWYYLAMWSLSAISGFNNLDTMIDRLKISRAKANQALEFLRRNSLVIERNGRLEIGPTLIHLESSSPNIPRHHQSWRTRAFHKYDNQEKGDIAYTAPVTLSKQDAQVIRERVLKFISDTVNVVKDSPSEELYCLTVDWFRV